nr:hypothetical protein [Tanacetum cinerariifolium]
MISLKISKGNNEDDSYNKQDSRSEGSDEENDSNDDNTQSDGEKRSDSEHETDENESDSESDQEENEEEIGDDEEEEEDEFVRTPRFDLCSAWSSFDSSSVPLPLETSTFSFFLDNGFSGVSLMTITSTGALVDFFADLFTIFDFFEIHNFFISGKCIKVLIVYSRVDLHDISKDIQSWNRPAFCNNDDDDDEDCTIVVTPGFLITDSLIMENEHLDTISEMKSDEFIKSSVENLVSIPNLESTPKNDRFNTKSYLLESLLSRDELLPSGIDNDDSDSEGDNLFLERLLHDDPIPLLNTLDFSYDV